MTETTAATNMLCPKCGQFQARSEVCAGCGVVMAKLRAEPRCPSSNPAPRAAGEPLRDPTETLSPGLPLGTKVALWAVAAVVVAGLYLLATPRDMGLDELVAVKQSASYQLRGFRIEGVVDGYDTVVEAHTASGRSLASLRLRGNGVEGYVTYDPQQLERRPQEGERVRVTGSFQQVPYFDGRSVNRKMTIALARRIELLGSDSP